MYSYIKIILQTLLICLLLLKCENDPVNITSDYIQSDIETISFNILDSESCSFQNNVFQDCLDQAIAIDSIQIIDSYRLYSGYPIETNESFESYMLFNIDISKISDETACLSDNFSSVKLELSSYNQLLDLELNEETEEDEVSDIYIDESGIDISVGHLNVDWAANAGSINYNDFINEHDLDLSMSNVDFEVREYDIVIDSLEKYFDNFCSLNNLDILIKYQNSLSDDEVENYIEIVSSDYIFQPSQPQIYLAHNLLEEETIVENKYILESVFENNQSLDFNTAVVSEVASDDWGQFYLINSDDIVDTNLSSALNIDSLDINSPLISNIPDSFLDIELNFRFSVSSQDLELENFLPIEFYIQNLVAYAESSDPLGDNWNDCGSDGLCLGDLGYDENGEDPDGSEGNNLWDFGERYEKNNILDWLDDNDNNAYDFGESLIEIYNDFGVDDCPNIYEMGVGQVCASEEGQNSYNDEGTQNNGIYDNNEAFDDTGEDGCSDMYEDSLGGCLSDSSDYDEELNSDPNDDNYNIDPSNDNWKDYGLDGCFDEEETGDLENPCDPENSTYDEELNQDPNNDNYDFLSQSNGSELNGKWELGELTEGNGRYDDGEIFYDVGSNGLIDNMEDSPDSDNYDVDSNPSGTEGNGLWDNGEPFQDYGVDGVVNYLEENYNLSGTENNDLYNSNEEFSDIGEDGCPDEEETGDLENPCDSENSTYDEELNLDPNKDNYLIDINLDDWRDCGLDGLCYEDLGYEGQDLDGSESNGIWDLGEGTELNARIDWFDENLNNIIEKSDCIESGVECESWGDDGQDLTPDSLEFLVSGTYLSNNIIHNSGSFIEFYPGQEFIISDISDLIDDSKDVNIWISNIDLSSDPDFYDATINLRVEKPVKAIEFKITHSPNIYLDSINNDYTSIFYGGTDSLIKDISIYNINQLNENHSSNKIILNYDQGIKAHLDFEGLSEFINSDSSMFVDNSNSNLILYTNYIDEDYYFDLGFSDIYYLGPDSDVFLKRIYFDNVDSVVIPIGNLLQQFIDKTLPYNGIDLKIDGNGYNFNYPVFFKYNEGDNAILNPKLNMMYSK